MVQSFSLSKATQKKICKYLHHENIVHLYHVATHLRLIRTMTHLTHGSVKFGSFVPINTYTSHKTGSKLCSWSMEFCEKWNCEEGALYL